MDPLNSRQVSRDWRYLGQHNRGDQTFRLQAYHLLWGTLVHVASARSIFCNLSLGLHTEDGAPTTPVLQRAQAYIVPVWAISFSLAATQEVEVSFLSWGY